jgi:hypothetical protein
MIKETLREQRKQHRESWRIPLLAQFQHIEPFEHYRHAAPAPEHVGCDQIVIRIAPLMPLCPDWDNARRDERHRRNKYGCEVSPEADIDRHNAAHDRDDPTARCAAHIAWNRPPAATSASNVPLSTIRPPSTT